MVRERIRKLEIELYDNGSFGFRVLGADGTLLLSEYEDVEIFMIHAREALIRQIRKRDMEKVRIELLAIFTKATSSLVDPKTGQPIVRSPAAARG